MRVPLSYFPVILVGNTSSDTRIRLQARSLFLPPSLDPSASGILTLEPKVFDDMAMTVRADPQDRHRYRVTYPDGATSTSSSEGMVGVNDERMQCLLSSAKKDCAQYSPKKY